MWSSTPSIKPNAHPQNEEYSPVAIHNPLTIFTHVSDDARDVSARRAGVFTRQDSATDTMEPQELSFEIHVSMSETPLQWNLHCSCIVSLSRCTECCVFTAICAHGQHLSCVRVRRTRDVDSGLPFADRASDTQRQGDGGRACGTQGDRTEHERHTR